MRRTLSSLRVAATGLSGRSGLGHWDRHHDDGDVVFFMPVYRDQALAFASLERLRRAYPASRLVVLSDGDPDFDGPAAEARFGAEYVLGTNLYGVEHGGEIVHRILEAYMRAPARLLVRLDTDARVDRRFRYVPTAPGLYGTISPSSRTAQGGCVVLTHEAAAALHDRGVFRSEALLDPVTSWGTYSLPENLARKVEKGSVSYDKVLHWGCVEAGVPVRPFPEILSLFKARPASAARRANETLRYAIVHPDKRMHEVPS